MSSVKWFNFESGKTCYFRVELYYGDTIFRKGGFRWVDIAAVFEENGQKRTLKTDQAGRFAFPSLSPELYGGGFRATIPAAAKKCRGGDFGQHLHRERHVQRGSDTRRPDLSAAVRRRRID